MKLVAYYALHTLKNQIRKLMKTWVLIFILICFVMGVGIGLFAGVMSEEAEPDFPDSDVTMAPEDPDWEDPDADPDFPDDDVVIDFELDGKFLEALGGVVILGLLVFYAISADKSGSQIFLPADVNLLFASPMKPQSVLLFRLSSRLGMTVLASGYMVFQLPNMVFNGGLTLWAGVSLVLAFTITSIYGLLIQVMLYTICSTHAAVKKYLRPAIYAFLGVIVAGYLLYNFQSSEGGLAAFANYFAADFGRWIPIWGWIKAFCIFALDGNLPAYLGVSAALLAGIVLLIWVIWHLKADFYEDAMAKSEETAELLEKASAESSSGVLIKRKKDRSEKLRRDGIKHGFGANVFFFKAMYNRFRFAFLGCITKTMVFYLVVAAITALISGDLMAVALALGVVVFFRSLGNPLEQDANMDPFRMVPESAWAKVFWSLLGGTANCLLDVLPAVLLGALMTQSSLLMALVWIPLIVSVDYFATNVGAFIGVSVPVSAGKTIKQLVQVLFIYFGLVPDIVLAVLAFVYDFVPVGMVAITAVNLFLGTLFLGVSPIFVDAKGGKRPRIDAPFAGDLPTARKHFSRLGLGLFATIAVATVLQLVLAAAVPPLFPEGEMPGWLMWVLTFAPIYLAAFPIGYLILRKVPALPPAPKPARPAQVVMDGSISIFLMYAGNIVGILVLLLLQWILPIAPVENPLVEFAYSDSLVLQILVMVVLAPMAEEFLFRKQLIDRMRVYGEKNAVVVSALLFGLFHGNFSQFFYAAALGLVFGHLYLKTGRLRYTIGLHMFVNFLGSVAAPAIMQSVALDLNESPDLSPLEMLPKLLPVLAYLLAIFVLFLAGLVLFCIGTHNLTFQTAELELPRKQRCRTVWLNCGMLLFLAGIAVLFVLSVLQL